MIATKPVDFRKGHDGLAAVAERDLGLDPHSGVIVVFRAKRGDRIKVLLWDGSGMVMAYKRLQHGRAARQGPLCRTLLVKILRRPMSGNGMYRLLHPAG